MPEPTLSPYDPSLRDRLRWGLADLLTGLGASRGTALRYGDQLIGSPSSHGIAAADVVPGLGNMLAADDGRRAYDRGDYLGAGLGALGAIPALPVPAARRAASLDDEIRAILADLEANPMPRSALDDARDAAVRAIDPERPPLPPRSTMAPGQAARAEALGFNIDRELYHGTPFDVPAFDLGRADPHSGERAVFLTDQPRVAEKYATAGRFADEAPNVMPLVSRAQNPMVVEDFNSYARGMTRGDGDRSLFHTALGTAIRDARAGGHDALELRNMTDIGGYGKPQTQYVVWDPALLRSRFARFDPARKSENDLLAGLGSIGLLGGGAAMSAPYWQHDGRQ